MRGEVDFEPLHDPPSEAVADVAETLLAWHELPRARWLDGSETVAWNRRRVYAGFPEHLPFHLNGLGSPRDDVFDLALRNLHVALYAQGTVAIESGRTGTGSSNCWAARLLPLAAGRQRGGLVLAEARSATDPIVRAELTVALCLVRPVAATLPWLRQQLTDPVPRQRFCAAVALTRLGDPARTDILATPPDGCADLLRIGRRSEITAKNALVR